MSPCESFFFIRISRSRSPTLMMFSRKNLFPVLCRAFPSPVPSQYASHPKFAVKIVPRCQFLAPEICP
jgi:hypothetical protein